MILATAAGPVFGNGEAGLSSWGEVKGEHFIVSHESKGHREVAATLLRRAEEYYRKIAVQLGYARYSDFWTWENRVRIFLFSDQASFMSKTGQPLWSAGAALRHSRLFQSRAIMTYPQEEDFYDGLLPHETAHLILHDFIRREENLPIWFDEGVAQIQESRKSDVSREMMRRLARKRRHIPFNALMNHDIRKETDQTRVKIFYAESLSIVEFLLKTYGSDSFGALCRQMRDGKSFEEALTAAYPGVGDLLTLENKWISYIEGQ